MKITNNKKGMFNLLTNPYVLIGIIVVLVITTFILKIPSWSNPQNIQAGDCVSSGVNHNALKVTEVKYNYLTINKYRACDVTYLGYVLEVAEVSCYEAEKVKC